MIEVTVYKTMRHEYAGFDMSGHAGYDDIGKDIVCAAVSVLVINTLNSIERFTDDKTSCVSDENSGTVEFRFKDHPSHDAALLLDSIATGLPVNNCLQAAEKLAAEGIDAKVINIHTIKPLDEELIIAAAQETGKVVTVEEHSVIGGLGSAVCDVLSANVPTKVLKIGINDVYGESGPALELIEKYGLGINGIYEKVKAFVS